MCFLAAAIVCALPAKVADAGNLDDATTLVNPPWRHCFGIHRVGQSHLNFYSGYRKQFRSPQGIAAVKLVFNDEEGRGDDDELTVYGANSGSGEIIYNPSLISLAFYGREGSGEGDFHQPRGIAADKNGLVAVADTGNNRVVFLLNKNNELYFSKAVTLEETGLPLKSPSSVAIEADSVFITDSKNNRIVVTDTGGRFLRTVETSFPLYEPYGIAVIAAEEGNHYHSRFIVVTDSLNKRIARIALSGALEAMVRFADISDRDGGFFYPAIDYYSNVYVTDSVSGCLYKFDKTLGFLTRFGCSENAEPLLDEPRGISIYRRFGQVFVAERAGASYFWVGTDIRHLSCRAEDAASRIVLHARFLLTEHSTVTASLETEDGKVLKIFTQDAFMEPGNITIIYQVGKNLLPCGLANCKYFFSLAARPTYSSKKYLRIIKKTLIRNY